MVSSDFGQLAANRQRMSGVDWAMAGAATADAAIPRPAALRNSRRFMAFPWSRLRQAIEAGGDAPGNCPTAGGSDRLQSSVTEQAPETKKPRSKAPRGRTLG